MPHVNAHLEAAFLRMLELDATRGEEAVGLWMDERISTWGPAFFRRVAVAREAAANAVIGLALEERRRGLDGLGEMPVEVEEALARLAGPKSRASGAEVPLFVPARPAPAIAALDAVGLARRAHRAMLHLESLCRVEVLLFSRLARAWSERAEPLYGKLAAVGSLIAEAEPSAVDAETWVSALALAERLRDRGAECIGAFVAAIEQGRLRPPPRVSAVVAQFVLGLQIAGGRHHDAAHLLDLRMPADASLLPLLANLGAAANRGRGRGHSQLARALLARRLRAAWAARWRSGWADGLRALAILSKERGRLAFAQRCYEMALAVHREIGDRCAEGRDLGSLANFESETGDPQEARRHYEGALAIHRRMGNRVKEGNVLGNLAILHAETGAPQRALELCEESLAMTREAGNRVSEGYAVANLAALCFQVGRPERARVLLQEALVIHRQVGNRVSEASVLGNLAVFHAETGSPRRARELNEKALEILRQVGDRTCLCSVLTSLAVFCREDSPLRALALYEEALALSREHGNRANQGYILVGLASFHLEAGEFDQARPLFVEALAIARAIGHRRSEGVALRGLAEIDRGLGQVERACERAGAAVALLAGVGDTVELRAAHHIHARALTAAGDRAAAGRAYLKAIAAHENRLHIVRSDPRRAKVMEEALPCFQDAVRLLLGAAGATAADLAAAFDTCERAKARSLLERVRSRDIIYSIPDELAAERTRLEVHLRALQDALLHERSRPVPRQSRIDYIENELGPVRRQHVELLDTIAVRFAAYAAREGLTPPLSLEAVQSRVVARADTAILEYFVTAEDTFLWVIRRRRVEVLRLGLGEAELTERIETALRPFRNYRRTRRAASLLALLPERLHALFRHLMAIALPHLEGIRRLLIVPSGPIHEVPFEMLVLRSPAELSASGAATAGDHFARSIFVADRFDTAYGPSATLLDPALAVAGDPTPAAARPPATAVPPAFSPSVLAMGDPVYETPRGTAAAPCSNLAGGGGFARLPGTRREVEVLQCLFTDVRALLRAQACESTYRRYAPTADIVHLGCHGVIDTDEPAYSGVVLSPGTGRDEDAFLQAYEIARVRLLRCPLVVVSACEVAGGHLSPAEGLLGLTRAFAEAGAGATVASKWPVDDDATACLMTYFYDRVAASCGDPVAALGTARRSMLAAARSSDEPGWGATPGTLALPAAHPYYWAGFSIHGISAFPRSLQGDGPQRSRVESRGSPAGSGGKAAR
jgi:CHAT domain-containing protein/tetratricopeptide (TPR) repeat protein